MRRESFDLARTALILLGAATAVIPAIIVLWSHTTMWPEIWARRTDTFFPNGPTNIFSDFIPAQRTEIISLVDGVRVRPIIGAPVYLLFQSRVHPKLIKVVLVAKPETQSAKLQATVVKIGYRTGVTSETNNFSATVIGARRPDGWFEFTAELPWTEMFSEKGGARRLVFEFPLENSLRWFGRSVRIFYEK